MPARARAAVAAVLTASALALAGCAGGGSATPSSTPTSGGDVVYAVDTAFGSFDPNVTSAAQDARVLRQLYDSLTVLDNGEPKPWLASAWEVSADGKTYTFTVRSDVTFHDGTPFDAAAVCFNLDRIKNPATASMYAIGLIGPYQSCAAPDAKTAVVTLATAYAPFLQNLSSPFLGMVSPTAAKAAAPADFAIHPVGSGPFTFGSYTPNDRIILKANAAYNWAPPTAKHSGAPWVNSLTFQIIPDPTVRLGSLRSGAIQGIGNVPETEVTAIKADPSLTFFAQSQSGSPFQLGFNTEHKPFDDPAVRAAIRSGIDVDAAVQALYLGVYPRAWGPLSPTTLDYDAAVENSYGFDATKAASALDAAGWKAGADGVRVKDGQRLTLHYLELAPNREKRQDIAQFVKSDLAKVGVEVNVDIQQGAGYVSALQQGNYDLAGVSLVSPDPNVLASLYSPQFRSQPGRIGLNYGRVDDPALTEMLVTAQQSGDTAQRAQQYAKIQQVIVQKAYGVPIYVPTYTVATHGIDGMRFDSEGYPVFYDVYLAQ